MSHYNLNPVEEEQVKPKSQSLTEKQLFAQNAGRTPETEETSEVENDGEEFSEPSQFSTTSNFWDRAGLRGVVVASVLFLGVSIFALMGQTLINTISSKPEPKKISKQSEPVEEEKEDIGALKTNLAIASQKAELQKLNSAWQPSTPAKTPKPKPKSVQTSTSTPSKAPVARKVKTTFTPPKQPVRVVVRTKPVSIYKTKYKTKTVYITKVVSKPPVTKLIWLQPKITYLIQAPRKQVQKQTITAPPRSPSPPIRKTEPLVVATAPVQAQVKINTTSPAHKLIVGTQATGRLQNTIVWTGNDNYQNQNSISRNYTIKLTKPLKNADGKVAIPADSLVTARLKSVSRSGVVHLVALAFIIRLEKGGLLEKPIPKDVLLIQASDGSPLLAKYVVNSQITTQSLPAKAERERSVRHGLDSTAFDAGNKELTAYNSSDRLSKDLQGEKAKSKPYKPYLKLEKPNEHNSKDSGNDTFTLKKDSRVQIFINKSFELSW